MSRSAIAADRGPSMIEIAQLAASNDEAIEAWDGVLFDRWAQFRPVVTTGLGAHGEAALRGHPPRPGERVLDIGCGFGDTTTRLADLVGLEGEAVGIDAAPRFIEAARAEAASAGTANVRFLVGDVQASELPGRFDYAFSRMGTMFFANPVAAMRNVRRALVPGGRLCNVVWRRKLDNDWAYRTETVVKALVSELDTSNEPTCGPGPFSMSNADTASEVLLVAGFEDVTLRRCDIPIRIGGDLAEAVDFVLGLGPAGEAYRLAGEQGKRLRPRIEEALRDALAEFATDAGVRVPASTWILGARVPA